MTPAKAKAAFPTEAALCDAFLAALAAVGGWTAYPETAGFDILAVYDKTGHQLGVEAKLALNAKVADQILPEHYATSLREGPDYRAVIVPIVTDASGGIAKMLRILGVMVWTPPFVSCLSEHAHRAFNGNVVNVDRRMYDATDGPLMEWNQAWHDWNPEKRCRLPEIVPRVRAGVPAPLQLTPWKIGALKVLAELELDGFVTAASVRACGIDARRFCASDGWLDQLGNGRWGRGRIPAFDQQHPEAYALVRAEMLERRAAGKT
jgi:hypothetical protein